MDDAADATGQLAEKYADKRENLETVLEEIRGLAAIAETLEQFQRETAQLVRRELKGYDWVGYYMLDPTDENYLVLAPFSGAPTEHTRIPVSEGICGAAVATGETLVIDDVHADPRYLSCSIETQSEIVVPIRVNGKIVGEIDIDSHAPAAFRGDDRAFVEAWALVAGEWMENALQVE
jgi:GAF domain-containing protein